MKLSQFRFKLPEQSIALEPVHKTFEIEGGGGVEKVYHRDRCKLMVLHSKSKTIEMYRKDASANVVKGNKNDSSEYLTFRDIVSFFDDKDTFLFNDTRVFPARLYGKKEKTDAEVEVFLLRELNEELRLWDVLVDPARKIRIGNKLFFGGDNSTMVAEVIDNTTSRGRTLRFLYDCPHDEFIRELYSLGQIPLPRYIIDRRSIDEKCDVENFQTIYASKDGAVTAPSTGLHFSRELMKMLEIRGVNFAYLTVHCGLGNFEKIEVEDLAKHKMSSERMHVGKEACDIVNQTKSMGHRVCAVGVSTLRATETAVGPDGMLKEFEGWTNKFIFPPYKFSMVDSMVTNFYHPESLMIMATASFGGYDLVMEAYNKALENGYKFGCYGDAMLILSD